MSNANTVHSTGLRTQAMCTAIWGRSYCSSAIGARTIPYLTADWGGCHTLTGRIITLCQTSHRGENIARYSYRSSAKSGKICTLWTAALVKYLTVRRARGHSGHMVTWWGSQAGGVAAFRTLQVFPPQLPTLQLTLREITAASIASKNSMHARISAWNPLHISVNALSRSA